MTNFKSKIAKEWVRLVAIGAFFILTAFLIFFLWNFFTAPATLTEEIKGFKKAGESAVADLFTLPSVAFIEEGDSYVVTDTLNEGIEISYPGKEEEEKPKTRISLPKDYTQPIEIKLDDQKIITLEDTNNQGYTSDTLSLAQAQEEASFFDGFLSKNTEISQTYLRYQNDRKSLIYTYQRDRATGERRLKHWTFYEEGTGEESESYRVNNATLKKNQDGAIELYYQTEQDLKNEAATKEVDSSLMERAMRTLEKEGVNQKQNPDLLIPKPYYYDKDGNYNEAEWEVEGNTLKLNIKTEASKYPLALDPTLSFAVPGITTGGTSISSSEGGAFGAFVTAADINADSKADLVVSANTYSASAGRVYIFYNDSSYANQASFADAVITGEAVSSFGDSIVVSDLNADGRSDLVVGAHSYSSSTGRTYVFYNDGSIPTTAATADVIITGETSSYFGYSVSSADLNADSKQDLVVGANLYSTSAGRAYIFYNDGSIPTTAATADVIITGEASSNFGVSLTTGDLNADSKIDLVVGATNYSTNAGRAYIFYNDGLYPTTAATADSIFTGEAGSQFGISLATGDLNADGEIDLLVGAWLYSSIAGRAYIFYNDGLYPTTAATADVIIAGETSSAFGVYLQIGDLNADSKADIVVGASDYTSADGRTYVFYNDGSIPTTAATADVVISGESGGSGELGRGIAIGDLNVDGKNDLSVTASSLSRVYIFYSQNGVLSTNRSISGEAGSGLGTAVTNGDFNADGRVDVAVSAYGYSTGTGRIYIFYNDGSMPTTAATADVTITGETTSNNFGWSLAAGDLNADGKTDLAAGAYAYSSTTGRVYIFYNDGSIPTTAATADIKITGEATSNFGMDLATGDFNADGEVDLAVSADAYSTQTGRAYVFYNDGSYPLTAATADVIITGETTSDLFGIALVAGDFDTDGKTDLTVGASGYSSTTGRAYIFYSGSIATTTADLADVIIDGETNSGFGQTLAEGDLNTDSKTDLVVGGYTHSSNTGRVYIFYQATFFPGSADVIITGPGTNTSFGHALATGDLNADGRTDLIVGAYQYTSTTGQVYIFYNDGSIPTTAATADVILTGPATSSSFGLSVGVGDINADGKQDVVVGASGVSSSAGQVYFYEGRGNYSWQLQQQSLGTSRISPSVIGEELRVTGVDASDSFGYSFTQGDFNADGKLDLVVAAPGSTTGRVYIFYNDGDYSTGAGSADIIITGQATEGFGNSINATADLNADGKNDLVVGATAYSISTGRAYIFYNDGSIPTSSTAADVVITGETTSNTFGTSLTTGDLNADGKADLVIGATAYSTNTGRAYIFYNGSIITENASGADVIITGGATTNVFAYSLATGDLNADGKIDLVVGAYGYTTSTGRAYIFYNGSIITENASGADVTITGETTSNTFGISLTTGDLNADGKADLVVGASSYSTSTGRAYIFYNGSIITENASGADVTITGETTNTGLGRSLTTGDLNADGKADLVVGASSYSTSTGRAYIFYNGSIATENATGADVIMTGETTSSGFGVVLTTGDLNADGKTDLVVSAYSYSSTKGRIYIYTMNDAVTVGEASTQFGYASAAGDFNADGRTDLAVGAIGYSSSAGRAYIFYGGSALDTSVSGADIIITGEASSSFGTSFTTGDLNADGKVDLVVGASSYSSSTGRAYIFYNGSIITEAATGADIIITGETTSNYMGDSLTTGDLNADGKTDLIVGAYGYSSFAGRAYIFYNGSIITENASGADVIISGSANFSKALAVGDMNADGEVDLVAGRDGTVYIFYNDGAYPSAATSADVTISGVDIFGGRVAIADFNADGKVDLATSDTYHGTSTGRVYIFYSDGSYPASYSGADVVMTGESTNSYFGYSLAAGDLNADGRVDLIVGAYGYSSSTGRAYIFYNDGVYPSGAASADKVYQGGATTDSLSNSLTVGDFNADSITDLAIGAYGYGTYQGKVHTFITEIKTPTNGTYNIVNTPDGNGISASLKSGTVKIKGGTIKIK